MNILHIQYGMPTAGNAAYRLHSAMRACGVDSHVLTIEPAAPKPFVYHFEENARWRVWREWVNRKWDKRKVNRVYLAENVYFFSGVPLVGRGLPADPHVRQADVIYLHWVAGNSLSMRELEQLAATGKPILFFLHDMWPVTGGCHHSFDCPQLAEGCHDCPMIRKGKVVAERQAAAKAAVFARHPNVVAVAPSSWMAEQARRSFVSRNSRVAIIPNLVDEALFRPMNKRVAKEALGLPADKKIVTFGCQAGTGNPFKGWRYLQQAMQEIRRDDIHVLIFGSEYNRETQDSVPYPITFLGPVYDERLLVQICNATDVFVSPSLVESFGMTFLENIKCGTPVVGFANTAIPEIVATGVTGYLAADRDAHDLALGIVRLLDQPLSVSAPEALNKEVIVGLHLQLINESLQRQ